MKKPITKELAEHIEGGLSFPLRRVRLIIDGHEITLVTCIHKFKLGVNVYVDGFIRCKDMIPPSEIGQKFWWPTYCKPLYPRSMSKKLAKLYDEARVIELTSRKLCSFSPTFPSPRAFICHVNKTCTSVALAPRPTEKAMEMSPE